MPTTLNWVVPLTLLRAFWIGFWFVTMYRAVWDWSHWMPGSGSENGDKFMKSGFSKAMRLKQKGQYSSDVRCRQHCGPCCVTSLKLGMHKSNNALFHSVSGVRKQLVGVCLFLERISFRVQTMNRGGPQSNSLVGETQQPAGWAKRA